MINNAFNETELVPDMVDERTYLSFWYGWPNNMLSRSDAFINHALCPAYATPCDLEEYKYNSTKIESKQQKNRVMDPVMSSSDIIYPE